MRLGSGSGEIGNDFSPTDQRFCIVQSHHGVHQTPATVMNRLEDVSMMGLEYLELLEDSQANRRSEQDAHST